MAKISMNVRKNIKFCREKKSEADEEDPAKTENVLQKTLISIGVFNVLYTVCSYNINYLLFFQYAPINLINYCKTFIATW